MSEETAQIMDIPVIVVNPGGGILQAKCYPNDGTISYQPYIPIHARKIPNLSFGNVTYHTLEHEAGVGIHVGTVTERMIKIYVDSVSGATEETDTGDGSEENPFRCLCSAFRYLEPTRRNDGMITNRVYVYPSEKLIGCCQGWPYPSVQIILTGVVDYEIPYKSDYLNKLVITGDGNTELRCPLGKTMFKIEFFCYIQNCKITASGANTYFSERSLLFDNCKIRCTNHGGMLEEDFWNTGHGDFYFCEIQIDGGVFTSSNNHQDKMYASTLKYKNSARELHLIAVDSCPNLLDEETDIDYLGIEYLYRSTLQTNVQVLNVQNVTKQCTINIDTTYDSNFDFHDYYFSNIHSSTIACIFRNENGVYFPYIGTGDVYDSTITYSVIITGNIDGGPYGYMFSQGAIIENSSFSGSIDMSEAACTTPEPDWYIYSTVYALSAVNDCAFKDVTISGELTIPSSISASEYLFQMCWVMYYEDEGFVHEGGGAFGRIAYASNPSMIEQCPMDPY